MQMTLEVGKALPGTCDNFYVKANYSLSTQHSYREFEYVGLDEDPPGRAPFFISVRLAKISVPNCFPSF